MHPVFWSLFGGRQGPVLYLSNATYTTVVIDPDDATTGIQFNNDGSMSLVADDALVDDFWLTNGTPGDFEIKVTPTSGTFSTGTTGTWLPLSSNRAWEVVKTTIGIAKTCTATFEIRDVATSGTTFYKSATITLSAQVTS